MEKELELKGERNICTALVMKKVAETVQKGGKLVSSQTDSQAVRDFLEAVVSKQYLVSYSHCGYASDSHTPGQ